jgi:hypothetical protein
MKTQNKDQGKRLFCFYGYTRNLSSLRAYTSAQRSERSERSGARSACAKTNVSLYYDGVLYTFVAQIKFLMHPTKQIHKNHEDYYGLEKHTNLSFSAELRVLL